MKNFALAALLFSASITYSQTAIISNKSHAGDLFQVISEPDHFGWVEPDPVIEKVILINETCIVLIGTRYNQINFNDTICDHYALKQEGYSLKACKIYYGDHPKYIGFKEKKDNDDKDGDQLFWINGSPYQNGIPGFFGLIILSYFAYLFTPIFDKKQSQK